MLPLEGVRVIDFSQNLAGPSCSLLLADFGAEVIKVEPPEGESSRRWGTARFGPGKQFSGLYYALNRNKAGIALDLKSPEAKAQIGPLIATADVVLENFKPGVADRLGIGYQAARALKADIVYCSLSGFGQTGPFRDRPGFDMLMQAYAGHMSITGEEGATSVRSGTSPIDLLTGAHGAFGIMVALRARDKTGESQMVDTSLYDSAIHMISHYIADYTGGGGVPKKSGPYFAFLAPYGMFEARDREFYLGTDSRSYAPFCRAIGRPDLVEDPLYATNVDRLHNRDTLNAELVPLFKTQDARHWVDICMELLIPTSLVETIPEVLEQEQAAARDMIVATGCDGVKTGGSPIKLNNVPASIRRQAPELGADNDKLLSGHVTATL